MAMNHYCYLSADKQFVTCSINNSNTAPITSDMLAWIQDTTKQQSSLSINLSLVDDRMLTANNTNIITVLRSTIEISDWFQLGLTLGLPSHELERVKREGHDEKECHRKMVMTWLDGGTASWKSLTEALINPLINKCELARRISNNYHSK